MSVLVRIDLFRNASHTGIAPSAKAFLLEYPRKLTERGGTMVPPLAVYGLPRSDRAMLANQIGLGCRLNLKFG